MNLANNLKYLRLKNNFSQDYIAELLGYKSYTTIQKWEMGISEPSISKLKILSDLYNVSLDEIINSDIAIKDNLGFNIKSKTNSNNMSESSLCVAKAYDKADENKKKIVELTLDLTFPQGNEYTLNAAHEIKGATDADKKHDDELMDDENF